MFEPRPISVWRPVRDESGRPAFVRPEPSPLGDHFADAPVLRPKRSELPLRVVLFGESAAAGYLYAPAATLAKILGATLETAAPGLTEVIDLARTNETLVGLAETVEAAIQIQPDLVVLYAGNNWNLLETPELSAAVPSAAARIRFAELLAHGLGQPVAEARRRIAERADAALDRIAALARAIGVPVVVVIPEVNLDGWENRQPPAGLDSEGTTRWHRLLAEGCAALGRGDAPTAALSARAMLRLDGGLCPTAYRLLGRALRKLGRLDEAASAFRAEIDAAAYPLLANLGAPQATSQTAEILNAAADRHGWLRVDLRALFAEASDSPISGRRFFLDYCHLTSEGLRLAAAAIAAEVLPFLGVSDDPHPDRRQLLACSETFPISPETEATARLGAAIHGAHRLLALGEKGAFVEPFLAEALALSPHAEGALRDLIEARTAPLPAVATAAQRRNLDSPCRLGLPHGWRWDFLDAEVLQAAKRALASASPGAAQEIEKRLLARAAGPEWTELARAPWIWEPLEQFFSDLLDHEDLPRRAFLRSPWPETSFALISPGDADLEIQAVLRCPGAHAAGAAVRVGYRGDRGAVALGDMAVGRTWSRATLLVPAHSLGPGLGRLVLAWPPLQTGGESPMARALDRLRLGLEADLHPVFGEISSLRVRTVPDRGARITSSEEGSSSR